MASIIRNYISCAGRLDTCYPDPLKTIDEGRESIRLWSDNVIQSLSPPVSETGNLSSQRESTTTLLTTYISTDRCKVCEERFTGMIICVNGPKETIMMGTDHEQKRYFKGWPSMGALSLLWAFYRVLVPSGCSFYYYYTNFFKLCSLCARAI